ncbi:hypothetical protein OESDEN_01977 [Oesophagostomum dentatum]|uniref:PABS domain-containing protein n=1 Tax=Oesophagostomum dentatum TaxID=61180 RepID=A0A0B1TLA9_OESDE|nr:hypothetical protein OESDEN_01977 [Oesophagostomum dentatum]
MVNFLSTLREAKLNMTSVEIDPDIRNIAVKWFGLKENDSHRVIIDDGVNFLRIEARKGTRYKAIFLDACFTMCPAEVFLERRVVADIAHVLDNSGVLAVNILTDPNKNERAQVSNRVLRLYRTYFSSCFLFYLKSQQILLCSHRTGWTFDEQEELFLRKLEEVDRRFNFHFIK